MREQQWKEILTAYTQPGADREEEVRERVMAALPRRRGRRWQWVLAVAASLALAVSLLGFTPQGQALAASVGRRAAELWNELFPPKEITVELEGMEEEIPHTPHAPEEEPEQAEFVIYVDESRYVFTQGDGISYIRPIPVTYTREDAINSLGALLEGLSPEEQETMIQERIEEWTDWQADLPPCEIRIVRQPDLSPKEAAEAAREALEATFASVSPLEETERGWQLWATEENVQWDSPVEDVTVVADGQGGSWVLTARYFLEATEGHGTRFAAMIDTFEVLPQGEPTPD